MALGHIAPGAITMPKKCQKYIKKYIPKYTKIYIWIYLAIFWYFFGMVMSPKKNTKNISKYIQDISKISKINTKYQAAAGPARPKPGTAHGPAWDPRPRGPGLGPGLGRAGGRLVFCIYLGYLGYILDIFGYMFGIFLFRRTGVLCV